MARLVKVQIIVLSKKTYINESNAKKACKKDGKVFKGIHKLPNGRFCYLHKITFS